MKFRVLSYELRVASAIAWVLGAGLFCPLLNLPGAAQPETPNPKPETPTVGMEGRLEVTLPGTLLEARPVEHKARLILRIAETRPRGDENWYDLRYVGFVPGPYDLRTNLVRLDGSSLANLPPLPVTIAPLLPEKHDGLLVEQAASPLGRLGGYRVAMIIAGVLWVLLFVPLVWRHRRRLAPVAAAPSEPTLADRLRPLVEQAAAGRLTGDGQAQLERMLLHYWCDRLQLGSLDMAQALRQLRAHAEAGELLRALESWLHRPPGSVPVDVGKVLEPYRRLPASAVPASVKG